jgi:hypothetical protein
LPEASGEIHHNLEATQLPLWRAGALATLGSLARRLMLAAQRAIAPGPVESAVRDAASNTGVRPPMP